MHILIDINKDGLNDNEVYEVLDIFEGINREDIISLLECDEHLHPNKTFNLKIKRIK